jgi:tripartite-type tricarboxylate transporter receptor subunit TctC
VRADSPYKTMADVLAAIKANPGKFKASGTGQGGIWHLALAGWLRDAKVDPASVPWVPSNGAAPACRTWWPAASNSCRCSLPEARSLIDAGKVRRWR